MKMILSLDRNLCHRLAICMVCFDAHQKKKLQIITESFLSLSCLSAETVTVSHCSGLDKRQLSISIVAFEENSSC